MKLGLGLLAAFAAGVAVLGFMVRKRLEKMKDARFTDTMGGQEAPNFEVTLTDGTTVTKESLLKDKDLLAVVLFATWCKPCEKEFPEMDEVYKKYQDRMAMVAIDVDSMDDEKSVKEYAEKHGFFFPVAMGNESLGDIKTTRYPTTLIIDRNGKIGLWRVGSIPNGEMFEKIVTTFMGDDYQGRQLGYYTFMAFSGKGPAAGVEFTVTSSKGTETYTTGENGQCDVFTDGPEDLKVKVLRVPEGYTIEGDGEIMSGTGSTYVVLPIKL
ncbi:MAG: TlpA family protein disulfide reductase [Solobacterium sp.]|nr:TlpA family protein disulfide reductase [Solobacterium sp.]MBR2767864.1 TlpA family protein disulfide reductase [Solobacterium sp.]